jgi:hypothetical protein
MKKKMPPSEFPDMMDFYQALRYLQSKGHKVKENDLRKEVHNFPERFGAMRRNPLSTRGRGGKFYFPKSALDLYTSLTSVSNRT